MGMKKNLLIFGGMMALGVVLAFILTALLKNQPASSPLPQQEELTLLFELEHPVRSVNVLHREGGWGYTLQTLSATESRVEEGTLLGREEWMVDGSRVTGVLNASRSLNVIQQVEQSTRHLDRYGLEEPMAEVEILDMGDPAQGVTLLVGDVAPGNVGQYLMLKGSKEVWMAPVYELSNFLSAETLYLNRTITDGDPLSQDFDSIRLGGAVREEMGEILIVREKDGYRLEQPFSHSLDESDNLLTLRALFGLQADFIAQVEPTPLELEALGLNEPYATAEVQSSAGSYRLSATSPDGEGLVYLYRDGVPLLYAVRHDLLPWLTVQYTDLMDPYACTPDLSALGEVEVVTPDAAFLYQLTHAGDTLSVTLDGQWIDPENFQRLYVTLISARLAEHTEESPAGGVPIVFIFREEGGSEQRVEFYPGPARRYFIKVDGLPYFLTPSTYLDQVLEDLEKVAAGEPVESYSY